MAARRRWLDAPPWSPRAVLARLSAVSRGDGAAVVRRLLPADAFAAAADSASDGSLVGSLGGSRCEGSHHAPSARYTPLPSAAAGPNSAMARRNSEL